MRTTWRRLSGLIILGLLAKRVLDLGLKEIGQYPTSSHSTNRWFVDAAVGMAGTTDSLLPNLLIAG